jgi:hypothetical protein
MLLRFCIHPQSTSYASLSAVVSLLPACGTEERRTLSDLRRAGAAGGRRSALQLPASMSPAPATTSGPCLVGGEAPQTQPIAAVQGVAKPVPIIAVPHSSELRQNVRRNPHRPSSSPLWFGTVHIPCHGRLGGLLGINSLGDDTGSFLALGNDEKQHSWLAAGPRRGRPCFVSGLHRTKRERYTAVKSAQEAWHWAERRISTV